MRMRLGPCARAGRVTAQTQRRRKRAARRHGGTEERGVRFAPARVAGAVWRALERVGALWRARARWVRFAELERHEGTEARGHGGGEEWVRFAELGWVCCAVLRGVARGGVMGGWI